MGPGRAKRAPGSVLAAVPGSDQYQAHCEPANTLCLGLAVSGSLAGPPPGPQLVPVSFLSISSLTRALPGVPWVLDSGLKGKNMSRYLLGLALPLSPTPDPPRNLHQPCTQFSCLPIVGIFLSTKIQEFKELRGARTSQGQMVGLGQDQVFPVTPLASQIRALLLLPIPGGCLAWFLCCWPQG